VPALKGEPLTLYGTGEQTRSFCYVDDLIEGFLRMMDSAPDFTGPVNLGNPGEFTMRELADLVLKQTDSRSKVELGPLPADDPTQRRPDISLATEKLAWVPKVSLEEGLRKTIAYFEKLVGDGR
jgi:UDP-glucuronate decarboxylase